MFEIKVNLAARSYVITIGPGILNRLGQIVCDRDMPTSAAVVSNPTVARYYADTVLESLRNAGVRAEIVLVPAGERFKTLKTVSKLYDSFIDLGMDRRSAVIALGGGVVGDMAGFAAATYMRGIPVYQVPTTLLAQVDASIGGKTGVDLPQGKNLAGAFHQPGAVLIDTLTLNTLPVRELRSGLAEVVKHGIIYDQEFFRFLGCHAADLLKRQQEYLQEAIRRSVEIKRDVVELDERESGLRAILNYGHSVGHAIEVLGGYGKYRHGEASAIGMVTEALLSEMEGYAQEGLAAEVADVLSQMRLPVHMDRSLRTQDIVSAVELDKKNLGRTLRMALPTRIGKCEIISGISRQSLARAIDAHRVWER